MNPLSKIFPERKEQTPASFTDKLLKIKENY